MKGTMKRAILSLAVAAVAASAMAQSASDVRIYINPGHGSWGPNDRPMPTIPYPNLASTGRPDTCGFYESNTDLWKCLKLGETLEKMGVQKKNIMYSRRLNGPYPYVSGAADAEKYNRSLSEISAEVDANNMDMFISIHSNAATDGTTTNYPLFLYRGNDGDGGDYAKGSRDICKALWKPHYMDELDPQSAYSRTSMNIRGDVDFYHNSWSNGKYTGYLGVLMHSVPGCLIEGFFHTYQPARHRALNKDYCGQEGVRVARGVRDYFNLSPETTGYIMGTVKDMHEKIANRLFNYAPNTNDQWLPVNGAKVLLKKGGETVQTYQVDKLYNGIFVFEGLAPGDYTLEVEADGYKPLTGEYKNPVTVKANETSYVKLLVESSSYTPPVIVYKNYPDPEQPGYLKLPAQFKFTRTSKNYTSLKGDLKRAIVRGDSAVVLADNAGTPEIHLINLKTNTYVKKISTTGIVARDASNAGDYSALSDIAFTADGKLVGVNSILNQYSGAQVDDGYKQGTLRLYKWDDFNSNPTLWATTQNSANFYRAVMGKSLAVSGESKDCTVLTTATTTADSKGTRMLMLNIVDNTITSTVFTERNIGAAGNFSLKKQGENLQLTVSPLADDKFVIDGELMLPQEFTPAKISNNDSEMSPEFAEDASYAIKAGAAGVSFFKYAGRSLMVAPYVNGTSVGGLRLYDITDGMGKAVPVSANANSTYAASALPFMASGSKVDGEDLTLYMFTGNKITKFTTVNVSQPVVKGITAYDLKYSQGADGNCTFSFTANTKPLEASVIFYDPQSGEALDSVAVSSPKEGVNTVNVAYESIPKAGDNAVTWAVRLKGTPVTNIVRLNAAGASTNYSGRAYCAVDNSPESDYFGRTYVMNYASYNSASNGLYAYTPAGARINSTPYRGGQNLTMGYRISVGDNGKVYMADYSDNTSGVYVGDPANLTGSFTQFFAGTRNDAGLISNGSVKVGSSTPCVTVRDGKMYVMLEDFGNNVGIYNIGAGASAASTWTKAPSRQLAIGSLEANGDGQIVAGPDGGVWVSQLRYVNNNTANVPSLIYVNSSGKVVFNSGSTDFADKLSGSCGAGFAVSRDNRLLVINDGDGVLQFFDVTWSGGTPALTPKYSYTAAVRNESDHNAIYQMAFDYGGNLVCSGSSLGVYSIPNDRNETLVPARKSYAVVNSIDAPKTKADEAVRYDAQSRTLTAWDGTEGITVYDASGAKVLSSAGGTLSLSGVMPGVYMVKAGNAKAVKIMVR